MTVGLPGFTTIAAGGGRLIVRDEWAEAFVAAGFDRRGTWAERAAAASGSGRGGVARLELPGLPPMVAKAMRRGGWLARLIGDRHFGRQRLTDNLLLPDRLRERVRATPRAAALFVARARGWGWRGWLAGEAVEGAKDLGRALAEDGAGVPTVEAAMAFVRRFHDEGLEHRDLNLGNILVREGNEGPEFHVIDLDRARLHSGPLPFELRLAGLRRLERSYRKSFGEPGPLGPTGSTVWYRGYAGDDARLAERLERGRRRGQWLIALHRLRW